VYKNKVKILFTVIIILFIYSYITINKVSDEIYVHTYEVNWTLEINSTQGGDFHLYWIVPDNSSYQCIYKINYSDDVDDYVEDDNENIFSFFKMYFKPGEIRNISMNFMSDSIQSSSQNSNSQAILSDSDREKYTSSQYHIESDDSKIIEKAIELTGNLKTDLEKAKRLQEWVTDYLVWSGYSSKLRGGAWALENGCGDCSEFAALFISLCRAVNIPSRYIVGFAEKSFQEGGFFTISEAGHDWAEVFIPNLGWVWVDPTYGWFDENDGVHISLQRGIVSFILERGYRFRYHGNGFSVREYLSINHIHTRTAS
jgi:transglutaminase-like putative cysteine protease